MKWLQFIAVFIAFQVEIHVKASSPSDEGVLFRPESCLRGKEDCEVKVGADSFVLPGERGELKAAPAALLSRFEGHWKLMRGVVRVREREIDFAFGKILKGSQEVWILDTGGDQVTLRAVAGPSEILLKDGRQVEIPQGFEIWVGSISSDGKNSYGVPTEIHIVDHLQRWAKMDHLNREKLEEGMKELSALWKDRPQIASHLYQSVIDRQIASVQEEQRVLAKRRKSQEMEQESYRRLLRQTAFEK